jgi:uncharacterized membrane protein
MSRHADTAALRIGAAALGAQSLLQLAWHAWIAPASRAGLVVAVLPLLPALWIALHDLRRGVLIGGIVSLFYFCHAVAELYARPTPMAAAEAALALLVIATLYFDARAAKRRARLPAE